MITNCIIVKRDEDPPIVENNTITNLNRYAIIPIEDYEEYVALEDLLSAFEQAGFDNWEGYDHAMEIYRDLQRETKIWNIQSFLPPITNEEALDAIDACGDK